MNGRWTAPATGWYQFGGHAPSGTKPVTVTLVSDSACWQCGTPYGSIVPGSGCDACDA